MWPLSAGILLSSPGPGPEEGSGTCQFMDTPDRQAARQLPLCLLVVPRSGFILGDVKLHFKITTFKEEYELS